MLRFLLRRPKTVRVPIENGPVDIQKVQVKEKSRLFFSKFIIRVALTYCVLETVLWMRSDDFKTRFTELNKRLRETPQEGKKRLTRPRNHASEKHTTGPTTAGSSGATSLPQPDVGKDYLMQTILPVWFRERKRQTVKESDPEWQTFLQFQQDQKKLGEVKKKVVKAVVAQLNTPYHVRQLQYIGFNLNVGSNLEVITPIYAPVAYEVPSLSITSDWRIELCWESLPPTGSAKIERMFHPVVFSQAFFAAVQTFFLITFDITKAKVLDQYQGGRPSQIKLSMVQRGNQKLIASIALEKSLTREEQIATQLPLNRIPEEQAKKNLPFLRGESAADSIVKRNYRNVISSTTYQDAIEHASAVFKQTWLDNQLAALQETTSGVVTLKGMADCMGQRGRYRLEVTAFYLPEEDAFVGRPRITGSYIIPDLARMQTKSAALPRNAVLRPQPGGQSHPDQSASVPQPHSPGRNLHLIRTQGSNSELDHQGVSIYEGVSEHAANM